MFSGEEHVAGGRVDLRALQKDSEKEAPEDGVPENGSSTGCENRFAVADGNGCDDDAGSEKADGFPPALIAQCLRRWWIFDGRHGEFLIEPGETRL